MSGQGWEVVGKGNKKPTVPAKKMSKTEKLKFVENAPKIEDIVPLDQLRTLYNTLDNKENSKPPQASTETVAKKPKKKPQEKKKEPVKTLPKSLNMAASQLDFQELNTVVEQNKNRFPEVPLLWLKSLAEYLNTRLAHSGSPLLLRPKDTFLPLMPANVRDYLQKTVRQAGPSVMQPFFHHSLTALANEMSKGNSSITGYLILLQVVSAQSSGFSLADVDPAKVASLRQSYQNKQPIGLAILWALGQLGMKNVSIGVQVWQEFMVPVMELRNYSPFVVQYLEEISAMLHQDSPLSGQQMINVLDFVYSPSLNVASNLRQSLYTSTSALVKKSLQVQTKPASLQHLFQQLLERLTPTSVKALKEELLSSLTLCLKSDMECFAVWQKLYEKQTGPSALLLEYLNRGEWMNLNVKILRETLLSFQGINITLLKGKQRGDSVKLCQAFCQELISKMTLTRTFPWRFCSFLMLLCIGGLVTYDIQKHGGFKASSTGLFLRDTGALDYADKAWCSTKQWSGAGYEWAQENVPVYYKATSEAVKPYLGHAKDAAIVVGSHLNHTYWNVHDYTQEKAPHVRAWINHYAPGLIDGVQTQSIKAWGVTKEYTFLLGSYAVQQSNNVCDWAKTNIFVGSLSPEKLHQYSQEAINTTQVYAAWTYDWVREKVHTLSKVQ